MSRSSPCARAMGRHGGQPRNDANLQRSPRPLCSGSFLCGWAMTSAKSCGHRSQAEEIDRIYVHDTVRNSVKGPRHRIIARNPISVILPRPSRPLSGAGPMGTERLHRPRPPLRKRGLTILQALRAVDGGGWCQGAVTIVVTNRCCRANPCGPKSFLVPFAGSQNDLDPKDRTIPGARSCTTSTLGQSLRYEAFASATAAILAILDQH